MHLTILGLVALTVGVLIAMFTFFFSSLSDRFTTKDKIELYALAAALYVGGVYAVISNVCTGS